MGGYERPQFKVKKKIEYLDKKGNVIRTEWKEVKTRNKKKISALEECDSS